MNQLSICETPQHTHLLINKEQYNSFISLITCACSSKCLLPSSTYKTEREKLFPQKLQVTVTENTVGLPVSRSMVSVCSAPPTVPICVCTERENMVKLQWV